MNSSRLRDVPNFLSEARRMLELAIGSTPTSLLRTLITDANISVMLAQAELVEIDKREGALAPKPPETGNG